MSDMPVLEPAVVTAIEDYFRSLQAHASAEQSSPPTSLRRLEPGAARSEESPAMPSIPGSSTEVTEERRGVWRRSWLMASPTSTTRRNGFSRCFSKASTPKADRRAGHLRSRLRRLRAASATSLQRVSRNMLLGGGVYHTFHLLGAARNADRIALRFWRHSTVIST
jgi:hypothetical protein